MRWKVGLHDLKSNGIRVYYFYDSGGTTHICGVGYRVGSAYDPIVAKGLAHLTEHLITRESMSHNGDEVYRILWRYLGCPENWKIETDPMSTYYGSSGLYYRKYMPIVMPMLVSLIKDRLITNAGMLIEKGAVNNEIALTEEDVPTDKLNVMFLQTMYETNPIRSSILGTEESLDSINISRVRRFIRKCYVAENMFAMIFGPSRQESIKFAESNLNEWSHRGEPLEFDLKSFDRFPIITEPKVRESLKPGLKSHYVQLGFPTECYDSKDDAVLDVISDIIWQRVNESLRERNQDPQKGVYRSPGFTDRTLVHGVIGGWFATINKDYAFYGRDQVLKEFLKLREELLPRAVVADAVESIREQFLMKFRDSAGEVVDLVIEATCNGDPDLTHLHSYPERLDKITPRKIRDIANKYFKPNGYACAMLSPA